MATLTLLEQLNASSKEIRGARAERVVSMLRMAQSALVDKLKYQIMTLENEIESHLDFGRTSTTSLMVSNIEAGKAGEWVETLQNRSLKLAILEEQLKEAKKNYKTLFGKSKTKVDREDTTSTEV